MLDPNLLGRCRPTVEQISGTWYSHSHSWDKPAYCLGQTDPCPAKKRKLKKMSNKQGTK
jgi:hypothetical protein